ncbi:hypothetical protein NATSA_12390 [Natronogracilivirgula saccharolytica]|uniref:PEGA domain-containing protein n=1 Tax=Natronogracilivirga saccharolytica TaxID=2812953 RepID=A0A8J7SCF8_9BACT|nr:hypothetical protein [Natronogracilivirga saccharolytica]
MNDVNIGSSPVVQDLSRDYSHTIKVKMDGYESCGMILNQEVSGWV